MFDIRSCPLFEPYILIKVSMIKRVQIFVTKLGTVYHIYLYEKKFGKIKLQNKYYIFVFYIIIMRKQMINDYL